MLVREREEGGTDTETETDTDTQTHRHTDTQTHRRTDTQTHRHTERRSLIFPREGTLRMRFDARPTEVR